MNKKSWTDWTWTKAERSAQLGWRRNHTKIPKTSDTTQMAFRKWRD